MNKRFYVLMDEAGEGSGGGGEGEGDTATIDQAEFEKLKTDFTAANDIIKKLEANNQELLKEKAESKKRKLTLKRKRSKRHLKQQKKTVM